MLCSLYLGITFNYVTSLRILQMIEADMKKLLAAVLLQVWQQVIYFEFKEGIYKWIIPIFLFFNVE